MEVLARELCCTSTVAKTVLRFLLCNWPKQFRVPCVKQIWDVLTDLNHTNVLIDVHAVQFALREYELTLEILDKDSVPGEDHLFDTRSCQTEQPDIDADTSPSVVCCGNMRAAGNRL